MPPSKEQTLVDSSTHQDIGVDEFNVAEFPISVMRRKSNIHLTKEGDEEVVYSASIYDKTLHRRIEQTVTLLAPRKIGLPTPDAEDLLIVLILIAKQLEFPRRVHFSRKAIYELLGWRIGQNKNNNKRLSKLFKQLKPLRP